MLTDQQMPFPETLKLAKPGETVTLGSYPQTADGKDKTPIEWKVLQNSGSEIFLLSDYLLDCKRYHRDYVEINWRDCDLRRWLNDTFYHAAFDADEKAFIKTTHCRDNGAESPDTEDKVFLLNVAEAKSLTDTQGKNTLCIRRRAVGTNFAQAKKDDGCRLYVYDKTVEKDYLLENGARRGCSWWWLRSQLHESSSRAVFVGMRSTLRTYGRVDLIYYGVRPALKLDLNSIPLIVRHSSG